MRRRPAAADVTMLKAMALSIAMAVAAAAASSLKHGMAAAEARLVVR